MARATRRKPVRSADDRKLSKAEARSRNQAAVAWARSNPRDALRALIVHGGKDAPVASTPPSAAAWTPAELLAFVNGQDGDLLRDDMALTIALRRAEIPSDVPGLSVLAACRPEAGTANHRPDPIMPARLAQVREGDARIGLFSPAMRAHGEGWLPGFERETSGPCLPLALYDIGGGGSRGGPSASIALRIWVESVISVTHDRRIEASRRPEVLTITLRDFLVWLYGEGRQPRPNEYWPLLMRAVEALDSHHARVPWVDPDDPKRGGLRRIVSVSDLPRGGGALDDDLTVTVHLPPGTEAGPVVDRIRLRYWGRRSERAYRALLGLSYRWFIPGVTRVPAPGRSRHWVQVTHPDRYEPLSDDDAIDLCFPAGHRYARHRVAVEKAWATLHRLKAAGDVRTVGRRVLPSDARGGDQ